MASLKQSKHLKIFEIDEGAIIYNKRTKKSCKLGKNEYLIFKEIDGRNTLVDIVDRYGLNMSDMDKLLCLFEKYKLFEENEREYYEKKGKMFFSKRGLLYNDHFLDVFSCDILKFIFNVVSIISIPLLIVCIVYMRGRIEVEQIISNVNILHILLMDLLLAISVSLHEFAHAICAKNNGAFVGEIGVKFDFFVPSAYTTLCGIDEIRSKYKKIQIFGGGMAINALIATGSLYMLSFPAFENNLIVFMLFSVNVCLIIVNCITAVKSDLYYVLVYILNEPNLKEDTIQIFKGEKRITWRRFVYIVVSYVFEPIVIISLLFIALKKIGG